MALNVKTYATSGNTAAIHTGPVNLAGYTMSNQTANTATITVYNALTAAGAVIMSDTVAANSSKILQFPNVYASVGVSVAITGTTPNAVGSIILE